jgi:hypothetical protein
MTYRELDSYTKGYQTAVGYAREQDSRALFDTLRKTAISGDRSSPEFRSFYQGVANGIIDHMNPSERVETVQKLTSHLFPIAQTEIHRAVDTLFEFARRSRRV